MLLVLLLAAVQLNAGSPLQQEAAVAVAVAVPVPVEVPGPGCLHKSHVYEPGERWTEDNGCTSCTCQAGHARCQAFMCQVTCDKPMPVPGECCPACTGQSVVTQAQTCPSLGNCTLRCTHGRVMDEAGCFACQCKQGAACTLECGAGAGYARDEDGNELCECSPCPAMPPCTKRCTHGYRKDAAGCSLCACLPAVETTLPGEATGCTDPSGGAAREDGEYWSDGCRGCYCSSGRTLCELSSCRDDTPALRRMAELAAELSLCGGPGAGAGVGAGPGAGPGAGCAGACRCLLGRVLCEVTSCPPAACPDPLPPDPTGCCPTCPPDTVTNTVEPAGPALACPGGQAHGSTWRVSDCTSCRCERGREECFEQRCPTLQCDLHFTPKGLCCPVCLGERGAHKSSAVEAPPTSVVQQQQQQQQQQQGACWWGNQSRAMSEEWFADECTRCQCDPAGSGSSTCTHVVCTGCTNQHGYCCPPCSDGAGSVTVVVALLAVTALVVLGSLAVGYFVWHRHHRRQTLDIARVDALKAPGPRAPAHYTTYKIIPTERR